MVVNVKYHIIHNITRLTTLTVYPGLTMAISTSLKGLPESHNPWVERTNHNYCMFVVESSVITGALVHGLTGVYPASPRHSHQNRFQHKQYCTLVQYTAVHMFIVQG